MPGAGPAEEVEDCRGVAGGGVAGGGVVGGCSPGLGVSPAGHRAQ